LIIRNYKIKEYLIKNMFIYVLKLESNKYYIGRTSNPEFRLNQHNNSCGSNWTNLHKPIELINIFNTSDNYDEDKYTLKYMEIFGIDNVRGGSFCQIELTDDIKKIINRMINGNTDKCYKCGKKGHYINNCPIINENVSENIDIELDIKNKTYVITNCDWNNKYYFTKSNNNKYYIKYPGIFRLKENRHYGMYITLQYGNIELIKKYFTINEYMKIINEFWDITSGEYSEKTYLDGVNTSLKKYNNNESLSIDHYNRMSNIINTVFIDKGFFNNIDKIKIWYEKNWSNKSEDKLNNMLLYNSNITKICIGMRLVFCQKSFGCVIVGR
jgi:hypothetical protein